MRQVKIGRRVEGDPEEDRKYKRKREKKKKGGGEREKEKEKKGRRIFLERWERSVVDLRVGER